MRIPRILTILLCVVVLASCRSSHTATKTVPELPAASVPERYNALVGSCGSWNDVSVPLSVDIVSPKSFSISGRAKMVRGKSVDISLRMFGFEVGRIYANADSIYGMVKVGKTYMAESLAEIFPGMPFTIGNLQDMLMGRVFLMGSDTSLDGSFGKFDAELTDFNWILVPKTHPKGIEYGFTVSLDDVLRSLVVAVTKTGTVAQCDYGNAYADKKTGVLMNGLTVKAEIPRNRIDASIAWRWNDANWNQGVTSSWSTPKGYKRVKASELMKSIN